MFFLDAIRVVTVRGAVRQTAGRRRAVAVATRTGTGGRRAIGVVRVASRTGLAAALRRAGRRRGGRTAGTIAVRGLGRRAVRVRVLLVGATRRCRRGIVRAVIARRLRRD